jgi:hypothetical protein
MSITIGLPIAAAVVGSLGADVSTCMDMIIGGAIGVTGKRPAVALHEGARDWPVRCGMFHTACSRSHLTELMLRCGIIQGGDDL